MQPPNPASSSLAHSSQFDECAAIVAIPSLLLLCAFSDEGDFDSHHLYDGGPISNGYGSQGKSSLPPLMTGQTKRLIEPIE